MEEDPFFIQRRISHYGAMLKLDLDEKHRTNLTRLLAESEQKFIKATVSENDFPVVCVGGSSGGLDAYTRLLRHLPVDMGVAIVIVNHLRIVATHLHEI